jgi:regulator of replication initiation timing
VAALHAQNERLRLENERLRMLLEEKGAQIAGLEERQARG